MGHKGLLKQKWKEKLDMYDMIIANLIAGTSVIEPDIELDKSHIDIGFSNIASATSITKYFVVSLPDWLQPHFMDTIRSRCVMQGVKINFYIYCEPHTINWGSTEMKNRLNVYEGFTKDSAEDATTFNYRNRREEIQARDRIIESTKYLNAAELDYKRTLSKVSIVIEVNGRRDHTSLGYMNRSIRILKKTCTHDDIKLTEMKVNMIDWLQNTGIFSLKGEREVIKKLPKRILTDDILANLNSYKQGKVGDKGIPIGMDVVSKVVALVEFKDDPDKVENWLISATSGGGKSLFVKVLLTWLLGAGFVATIMDYEGDEYNNFAAFVRQSNAKDVKVISMGKGSTVYFDPMEIGRLTGDPDIDVELKETAIGYILSYFRLMVAGIDGQLSKWESSVISTAIKRVYEQWGVTDNMDTWHRSAGMHISMVYDEIVNIVESKEFMDDATQNIKHRAAMEVAESCRPYFEEGEAKSGTFKNPMPINELYDAILIVFSFGMRGATASQVDPVILALKQLSVANISIQISNYCKYVRHCFNVKVWEEYQRWGDAKGSAEIIGNTMTGGRKRGDVNFILTNDLAAMLDDKNPINEQIRQNISSYAIGKIKDKDVIDKFCEKFQLNELEDPLELIARANTIKTKTADGIQSRGSKYKYAFCVVTDTGKKAIVKAVLPPALMRSSLFKTGVAIKDK